MLSTVNLRWYHTNSGNPRPDFHPTNPRPMASSTPLTRPRIIIHGGAGNITRANLPPPAWSLYRNSLLHILRATSALLASGTSALDAATSAATLLEENPLFNCGKGAVFTRAGTIELEASVMVSRGYRKRGVGVALVKKVRNPIKLAREMLVRGEIDGGGGGNSGGDGDPAGGSGGAQGHCFLSGTTVEELAEEWGLEMCEEKWHWTKRRWEEHRRGLGEKQVPRWDEVMGQGDAEKLVGNGIGDLDWDGKEYLPQGTVGCVCLDQYGTLCVATSTGGLTNKLPGRIGDTPTLGAGFWAEEWEVPSSTLIPQQQAISSLQAILPDCFREGISACIPSLAGYLPLSAFTSTLQDEKRPRTTKSGAAMSGTGNGDSFLRINAVRTAAAISHFTPNRPLSSAVQQIAGPGGELEASAGNRWGKTGEGEGGIIGIEVVDGKGEVVFDFNCGGMFRVWMDDKGRERAMVFREEY
ncbi:hypothetical protein MMC34_007409 [Xylographa carneopallida]|nr:hypothetical protein [Xylographa carneopallida]